MKVSIVISAYNAEKYIEKAITSCLNQTHDDIELIVVEDKSTDGTLEIIHRIYAERPFRLITHDENMGAGWSRRHGIEAATGDYVITVDADDWIGEKFIESLVKKAEETGADIVSGGITAVYPDLYTETKRFPEKESIGMQKFVDYDKQRIVFLNNKIVRRELFQKVPYCTRRYCEDTPVILPMLYYANMVAYADSADYFYLQHDESLCHQVSPFEDALFKGLCCADCIIFFSKAEQEYRNIVQVEDLMGYVRKMRDNMDGDNLRKYQAEFTELMSFVLKNFIKI